MTEKDVYQFYNDKVKIAYSEIEARNNHLPVELLFEVHSAFDHLKRLHIIGVLSGVVGSIIVQHLLPGLLRFLTR